jgi:hypothetical protein
LSAVKPGDLVDGGFRNAPSRRRVARDLTVTGDRGSRRSPIVIEFLSFGSQCTCGRVTFLVSRRHI